LVMPLFSARAATTLLLLIGLLAIDLVSPLQSRSHILPGCPARAAL
jgi:hypothetical protein